MPPANPTGGPRPRSGAGDRVPVDGDRDRLERRGHGRMTARRSLELSQRTANVIQRDVRMRRELTRSLELMQRAHRLCDRGREVDEMARHARIGLQGIEPARERFACGT